MATDLPPKVKLSEKQKQAFDGADYLLDTLEKLELIESLTNLNIREQDLDRLVSRFIHR